MPSLVGSEMCIRDSGGSVPRKPVQEALKAHRRALELRRGETATRRSSGRFREPHHHARRHTLQSACRRFLSPVSKHNPGASASGTRPRTAQGRSRSCLRSSRACCSRWGGTQGQHGCAPRLAPRHGAAAERTSGLISPSAPVGRHTRVPVRWSLAVCPGRPPHSCAALPRHVRAPPGWPISAVTPRAPRSR